MTFDWTLALGLVLTATLVASAGLLGLTALNLQSPRAPNSIFSAQTHGTIMIFDGEHLVDATPPARALLTEGPGGALSRALSRLEPMFPGLAARLRSLPEEGRFVLSADQLRGGLLSLQAEWLSGLTRLTLSGLDGDHSPLSGDPASEAALGQELSTLRKTLTEAPMPVWRQNANGQVIWGNAPYVRMALDLTENQHELPWPLPALFGDMTGPNPGKSTERRGVRLGAETRWFEVISAPVGEGEHMFYALPADRTVKAEADFQQLTQTLAKTFAQLPIGLAIFDSKRVLQMFNPALIDLTGLPAEFLIARPSLPIILDAMREHQMLPEPKDYRSWRRQMVEMEAAAASGLFEDIWNLPQGQTYRVSGRPFPNGALAFMIEDISSEMTRTRRYRADLELGQAVMDAISDAVVVFAQDGGVAMANTAAMELWGALGLDNQSPGRGEPPAIRHWREISAPSLFWNDLTASIGSFGPREAWDGEVRLLDGRSVECRVSPMPHGSTLVSFRLRGARNAAPNAYGETGERAMLAG